MFYNVGNRYWNDVSDIGGIYVDEIKRKEELVKMIEECENEQFLTFLYSMIISFKKKWGI